MAAEMILLSFSPVSLCPLNFIILSVLRKCVTHGVLNEMGQTDRKMCSLIVGGSRAELKNDSSPLVMYIKSL